MKSKQLILALALAASVLGDQLPAAASDSKTKSELEGLTTAWVIVEFNKDISSTVVKRSAWIPRNGCKALG